VASGEFKLYLLLPLIGLLAWSRPRFAEACRRRRGSWLGRVAIHPWKAVVLVGLGNFLLCALPGFLYPPLPVAHDEFCYLLAADTFRHGRLTNPTPPLWEHFETFHVIQYPTYSSKYPPGQGAFLALGGLLWRPILGVWISTALACAAVCWMLQAWLPPRWALIGGLLTAAHPIVLQWSYCYWGGSVALLGGAMVCGSLRRLVRADRSAGWPLGIGLFLLANSRPFEGLVFSSLMICGTIYIGFREKNIKPAALARRLWPPLALAAIAIGAFLAYDNFRVTGDFWRMPYQEHIRQYSMAPIFAWQKILPAPAYRHEIIKKMYLQEIENVWGHSGLLDNMKMKFAIQLRGWSWKGLWFPLCLALPAGWQWSRLFRLSLAILGLFFFAVLISAGIFPHYAAPAGGLVSFVAVSCLRQWYVWQRRRGVGKACVWWLCVACVITVPLIWARLVVQNAHGWFRERARIASELAAKSGPQLVIVRYTANHDPNWEWVYNGAEIEHAQTLWARGMGIEPDRDLAVHFRDRTVWYLDADETHPHLVPYEGKALSN